MKCNELASKKIKDIEQFFMETFVNQKLCKKENLKQCILIEGDSLSIILDKKYDMI